MSNMDLMNGAGPELRARLQKRNVLLQSGGAAHIPQKKIGSISKCKEQPLAAEGYTKTTAPVKSLHCELAREMKVLRSCYEAKKFSSGPAMLSAFGQRRPVMASVAEAKKVTVKKNAIGNNPPTRAVVDKATHDKCRSRELECKTAKQQQKQLEPNSQQPGHVPHDECHANKLIDPRCEQLKHEHQQPAQCSPEQHCVHELERKVVEQRREQLELENQELREALANARSCHELDCETAHQQRQQSEHKIQQLRKTLQDERQAHEMERKASVQQRDRLVREHLERESEAIVPKSAGSTCSEGRLKTAMTECATKSEELLEAIRGTEALLGEARRELAARQLRERRAAFEALYVAINNADEDSLEAALAIARSAGVESEDIEKGEDKLSELRSRTDEQRAAKVAYERNMHLRKEAFLEVKRDNADALKSIVESLEISEGGMRWQDLRDHAGRNLWQFAATINAIRVQTYLRPLLGCSSQRDLAIPAKIEISALPATLPEDSKLQQASLSTSTTLGDTDLESVDSDATTATPTSVPSPVLARIEEVAGDGKSTPSHTANEIQVGLQHESPDKIGEAQPQLKARAFRAVAQDDASALTEVLDEVPMATWREWTNKGNKDLLTLAEERARNSAYNLLATRLGLIQVKEMEREVFEERENVWIFLRDDVQAHRATVLEDTPAESDHVLVEFWDGDDPPSRVERCQVRKLFS